MADINITHGETGSIMTKAEFMAAGLHVITAPANDGDIATKEYVDARTYSLEFDEGDLVSGVLDVPHSLGQKICGVQIVSDGYDETGNPGRVHFVDTNNLTVDFSAFEPLVGTWTIVVRK